VPDRIRALTVIATDPSAAAAALHATLDWEIEADLGTFASLTPPSGIPLWLNAPADGEAASSGVVLHLVQPVTWTRPMPPRSAEERAACALRRTWTSGSAPHGSASRSCRG
jgi:hypothetical protein